MSAKYESLLQATREDPLQLLFEHKLLLETVLKDMVDQELQVQMQKCLQAVLRRVSNSNEFLREETCIDSATLQSMEEALQALLFKSELTTYLS